MLQQTVKRFSGAVLLCHYASVPLCGYALSEGDFSLSVHRSLLALDCQVQRKLADGNRRLHAIRQERIAAY
jgi:hypothetical protein